MAERIEVDFLNVRPHLLGLAYRMLGSMADSEDIVQEVWVRYGNAGMTEIEFPKAYFTKIATRLCLDQLKSARHKREQYIGTWLPEPVATSIEFSAEQVEYQIDISYAIMLTLEQLTPLERAAYLLHDLFELSFDEIGEVLEKNAANCRKLASRARQHLATREKRFEPNESGFEALMKAFFKASKTGDISDLQAQLAEDVKYYADGGGKILAAHNVITGANSVARMLISLVKKNNLTDMDGMRPALINGQVGICYIDESGLLQPVSIDLNEAGQIANIYMVRNPDKLTYFRKD